MKILIFANSSLFVKIVSALNQHAQVVGIIIPSVPNHDLLSTIEYAAAQQIPLLKVTDKNLKEDTTIDSWIRTTGCDAALVLTFPFKIRENVLDIPEKGFFNLHYSKLPAYKGPDPLFWQLKNGEKEIGLTIHKMTSKFDEGPIVFNTQLILFPGENYGLANIRLTQLFVHSMKEIFLKILTGEYTAPPSMEESCYKRTQPADLKINWERQSASSIEDLVNAANPTYNGAVTYLNGVPIRILEVSGVDGKVEPADNVPGTIFHIDPHHGPMVLTADKQLILLNIVEIEQGIFSGKKICAVGLKKGDRFMNIN